MSRTASLALRLASLAAYALVLAAPFRWHWSQQADWGPAADDRSRCRRRPLL